MEKLIFLINYLTYLFMFSLLFISANYKNVCFTVNFSKDSESFLKIAKDYRKYLFKITFIIFIVSLVICEVFHSFFYFGILNFLYISLIATKYLNCRKEVIKEALRNEKNEKSKSVFFSLNLYDFSFNLLLTLYNFYLLLKFEKSGSLNFSNTLYVIPLTLVFLNILIIFSVKIIKQAPDFNEKDVKGHIINLLWLISFIISSSFTFYQEFIIYEFFYPLLVLGIIILILGVISLAVYLSFIKSINKPYNFKVENERITEGRVFEVSLSGTKLFINFKNKKSYLFMIGFIVFILAYIFLVYLLTI